MKTRIALVTICLYSIGNMAGNMAFAGSTTISLMGGATYGGLNNASASAGALGSVEVKGGIGYAAGASVAFRLGTSTDFEVGALYLTRKMDVSFFGMSTSTSQNYLMGTGIVKLRLGRSLSLLGGGFYDNCLSSNCNSGLYGAVAGIRLNLTPKLFIEPRFNYDLKSNSNRYKEVVGLIGFSL